jgi:hypothetical protein
MMSSFWLFMQVDDSFFVAGSITMKMVIIKFHVIHQYVTVMQIGWGCDLRWLEFCYESIAKLEGK